MPGSRLYIGNVPHDVTEEQLRALFAEHRTTDVHIAVDRETGRPRGFAFVSLPSRADAQRARAQFDGAELGGRRLRVDVAQERERGRGFDS